MASVTKRVIVLGSTGSIGKSAIDIVRTNPDRFTVAGLSAHSDADGLAALTSAYPNAKAVLSGRDGTDALLSMIRTTEADIVVNGIAGASGLMPSIAAIVSGKDLALANKETIVMAGPLIKRLAAKHNVRILPVDSEHSAVFSLIERLGKDSISEIILTASGGPFRSWDAEQLKTVTPADALKHPTWSMGAKITIDSASMANKGLEVIEACRLFDVPPDRVKVVVHPQSLVHSLVRTKDGVLYAQISPPDMRHPILTALSWPEYVANDLETLDFERICSMQFEPPRYADFPMLGLAYRAAGLGEMYPVAFNAANEVAVAAFLSEKLSFPAIAAITAQTLNQDWTGDVQDVASILDADARARALAHAALKENSN
jgi:1-deoxy-D-xylulose-5-phosphate reductoisomerase